ncbi:hypothetical protein BC827DRAFT_1260183 [Russula dissimulans]|nr:hypothetical protein BC827DRAFT_1260183 [Russula dissimulans]
MADDAAAQRRHIVVLISGSGTNLQALIDAQNTPALPHAQLVLVLSNRKAAYCLTRAQSADPPIPTRYLALQPYLKAAPERTRTTYDAEITRIVLTRNRTSSSSQVGCTSFGEGFFDAVRLYGQRSFEAFQKGEVDRVGAMVHRVVKEVNCGESVVVREVEIKKGEARLHRTEWEIIFEATRNALDGV